MLKPTKISTYGLSLANGANYEVIMPSDYLHILNCICIYKVKKTYKCYNAEDTWRAPATRLTADMYSQVLDNFWNKPTYKRPYYYIHNVNTVNDTVFDSSILHATVPTNPEKEKDFDVGLIPINTKTETNENNQKIVTEHIFTPKDDFRTSGRYIGFTRITTYDQNGDISSIDESQMMGYQLDSSLAISVVRKGTDGEIITKQNDGTSNGRDLGLDGVQKQIANSIGLHKTINLNGSDEYSNIERGAAIRYGNVSEVRLEIRYGSDDSVFQLTDVYVDYIKAPQNIRLTQLEIDKTEDISQMLEYPDYVCQEIINELVHLVMENISDQRLQTHPVVSQSIANPAQQQTPEAAGQSA